MDAYALTDVGQVRSMNQDSIFSSTEPIGSLQNLFLVADGMGGPVSYTHLDVYKRQGRGNSGY